MMDKQQKIEKLKSIWFAGDERALTSNLILIGNETWAFNGHCGFCFFDQLTNTTLEDIGNGSELAAKLVRDCKGFAEGVDATLHSFDSSSLPENTVCETCNGAGHIHACLECEGKGTVYLSSDYNDYEVDCESCYGLGYGGSNPSAEETTCPRCQGSGKMSSLEVHGLHWGNDSDLGLGLPITYFHDLPRFKISKSKNNRGLFYFEFDGGRGVISPMRITRRAA